MKLLAKIYRRAITQLEVVRPASYSSEYYVSGCCTEIIRAASYFRKPYIEDEAQAFFESLFLPEGWAAFPPTYYWRTARSCCEHETLTPRIIALELCALIAEEQGL